jgi:hypothetical protein
MALVVKDRVQETSTTTGTGSLTLLGAVTGFQTFSSAIGDTNTTYYTIQNGAEWEVGVGTVSAGALSRDTVLESSNSGSLVNFSAGTKFVFCTYPAEKSVDIETAQTLTNKTISADNNTLSGIAASSFVLSNASGNIDGSAAQKAIPSGVVVGTTDSQTLTNKTISGASNTLSSIANASLTNSAITINGTSTSLGGSINVGTVTSVSGTSPVASSGGNTPDISLASGYGDTQNPYASKTANFVLAAPNGTAGAPTFRAVVAADIPTLNQNTTGSAATVTGNATGSTFGFNSGYGSVATAYGCRAWVNFNGTGTVAIRESGNVSSITDNGTGSYTANFTNAMPDASYNIALCHTAAPANGTQFRLLAANVSSAPTLKSTTQVRVASGTDIFDASISIFR